MFEQLRTIDYKTMWNQHDMREATTIHDGNNFIVTIKSGAGEYVGRSPDYLEAQLKAWQNVPQLAGFDNKDVSPNITRGT